jgi:hypothetical protein
VEDVVVDDGDDFPVVGGSSDATELSLELDEESFSSGTEVATEGGVSFPKALDTDDESLLSWSFTESCIRFDEYAAPDSSSESTDSSDEECELLVSLDTFLLILTAAFGFSSLPFDVEDPSEDSSEDSSASSGTEAAVTREDAVLDSDSERLFRLFAVFEVNSGSETDDSESDDSDEEGEVPLVVDSSAAAVGFFLLSSDIEDAVEAVESLVDGLRPTSSSLSSEDDDDCATSVDSARVLLGLVSLLECAGVGCDFFATADTLSASGDNDEDFSPTFD